MLETAGFSKSNPYYIVEQGKVSFAMLARLVQLWAKKEPAREHPKVRVAQMGGGGGGGEREGRN